MIDQEATEVETDEPAADPPPPAGDAPPPETEEFSWDDKGIDDMLKDVPRKGGVASKDVIRRIAGQDPEAAHILSSALKDYRKRTGTFASDRQKIEADRKALETERAAMLADRKAYQDAVLKSGLGNARFPAPAPLPPKGEPEQVDWSTLSMDPAAYAAKIQEMATADAYAKAHNELSKEFAAKFDEAMGPFRGFHQEVSHQAASLNVQQIIANQGEHWTGVKPIVDQYIQAENARIAEATKGLPPDRQQAEAQRMKTPFETIVKIARGEYFEGLHGKAVTTRRSVDTAQIDAARNVSRGGSSKGTLKLPDGVKGGMAIAQWQSDMLEKGWTLPEIQEYMASRR